MKKIYISFCVFFVFSTVFAQVKNTQIIQNFSSVKNIGYIQPNNSPNMNFAAPAPFWTNDFSNSNDWIMVDLVYGGLQNWVITTQGPQGSYSSAMGAISSTTASNGFALFDSDYLNNAYNPQEATLTYNGTVDCSAYQNVNINFECSHRVFRDSVFVETSYDNFATVAGRYRFHEGLAVNASSPNPDYVSINISSTAGGQSMLYFRFHYEGEWDYATMIDDVSFSETPNYLLTFNDETFGGWWIGYQATNDLGADYTFYPMNQAMAQPYRFEGVVRNEGIQTQNNVMLNVHVEDALGTMTAFTSNAITLNSGQRDTLATTTNFTPTMMGLHNFRYWGSSDSSITDTVGRSAIVTDTIYGLDFDWNSDGANAGGAWRVGASCGGQVFGNVFDIYETDTITSISFFVDDRSVVGAELKVEVYEMDGSSPPAPILLGESDDYTIQAQDINNWVTLSLSNPEILYSGTAYLAGVHGTQHPFDTLLISTNTNPNGSAYIQDNGCDIGTQGFGYWYSTSSVGLVRMNFGHVSAGSTNIEEYSGNKNILRIVDVLGRATKEDNNNTLFYIYDDGSVEKKIIID